MREHVQQRGVWQLVVGSAMLLLVPAACTAGDARVVGPDSGPTADASSPTIPERRLAAETPGSEAMGDGGDDTGDDTGGAEGGGAGEGSAEPIPEGGGGGSSTGGPCPAPPAECRILPMGDSVTFGLRPTPHGPDSYGGYRRYLRRWLIDAGRPFRYVGGCPGRAGRCRVPPDDNPPYCDPRGVPELGQHDGHPGWDINAFRLREGGACPGSIGTFLSRVTDGAGHVTPHIVLLMVGGNDVRAGARIRDGAAHRFRYLLDELLAALPSRTLIAVGTVTPNLVGTNNRDGVIPFNRAVRTIVRGLRGAGRNVMLVDTYRAIRIDSSGSSPDLSSDGVHPNERGYRRIAQRWYGAVGPLVPRR